MSQSEERLAQIRQFIQGTEFRDAELHPLAGDASFRRYVRVRKGDRGAMLMDAPPAKEDVRPFVAIAKYLCSHAYSAPKILAKDIAHGFLLLEDLGDDSFTSVLKCGGDAQALYAAAIDVLVEWHKPGFSDPAALPLPLYDRALLMREVALFSDWFLPQVVGKAKADALRAEYLGIWETLLDRHTPSMSVWVHRDYHADNLMWLPGRQGSARVGLLDFQDGVYGDAAYDLVSLLEDARRDVDAALVSAMLERYIAASGADRAQLLQGYALLGAQRNSKIVGIFTRLAARDRKPHYLAYLPRVWAHLEHDLRHPSLASLKAWVDVHVAPGMRGAIPIQYDAQALALSA